MGCGASKPDLAAIEQIQQNAEIERVIRQDEILEARTAKILLLGMSHSTHPMASPFCLTYSSAGGGESGKSTIIKQMRIIHHQDFLNEERRQTRAVIYFNMVVAFRFLLEIMDDEGFDFQNEKTRLYAETVETARLEVDPDEAFSDESVKDAMKAMWLDLGVQQAIAKGSEFGLYDNFSFYFQNLDRMFTADWIPDDLDILHAHQKTIGITDALFEMENINFRMIDIGDQRSERQKWISCFEAIHYLVFVVALSGYDQCSMEDRNINQMDASMSLFESLVNDKWFKEKPIVLFFNKVDHFRDKILVSPIANNFPDYTDGADEEAAMEYFADRFRAINRTANREIYIHCINATDTTLLKATMQSVQEMIVQKNGGGLIL